ncbi:MAG TPA: hypothetical protein VNT60_10570 [Deinococcales bacterium]|nr:hypothetical protein [Deinococcales bacterium]
MNGTKRDTRPLLAYALIAFAALMLFRDALPHDFPMQVNNWWALFIFVLGIGGLLVAYNEYVRGGNRLNRNAAMAASGAVFPLVLGAIFLFNLSWAWFLPAILVGLGLKMLSESAPGA